MLGEGIKKIQTVRESAKLEPPKVEIDKAGTEGKPAKKRSNAGRPSEGKENRKPAVFRLDPESIEILSRHAVKLKRSKSDLVNELIKRLDDE